jgi:hypothetical protein
MPRENIRRYDSRVETNAFGQPIRPLCFTREDDERLALGYPHLALLTEEPLDAKKAQAFAAKIAHDPTMHRVRFPRAAAPNYVRGARTKELQNEWSRDKPPPAAAFADASPVSKDEARDLVKATIAVDAIGFTSYHQTFYYVLEGLVGTEVVVDAIIDALEALPAKRFTHELFNGRDRKTAGAAFLLGFMFLRLAPASRAAREKRLRKLLDRTHEQCAKSKSKSHGEIVAALECVLDGWSAACFSLGEYAYASRYVFATDDLDRLRAFLADRETIFDYGTLDVRFVYLLGPEIFAAIGKRRPKKDVLGWMFEDLGMIKHTSVAELFLEYVGKPMAKDLPLKWFRAHADWARPVLKAIKNDRAKAVLGQL